MIMEAHQLEQKYIGICDSNTLTLRKDKAKNTDQPLQAAAESHC